MAVDKPETSVGKRVNYFLGLPMWAGVSAIIAALGLIVAILVAALASGGPSNSVVNNVNGTCNAAGTNNTVSCQK